MTDEDVSSRSYVSHYISSQALGKWRQDEENARQVVVMNNITIVPAVILEGLTGLCEEEQE